jgi:hypothetical protein
VSEPRTTSAQSPDTLPRQKYTRDQLLGYIFRQLGSPVWNIELTPQQGLDAIQDALNMVSTWRPRRVYGALKLVNGKTRYMDGMDFGMGIIQVDFVDPTPSATEIFYGNLITPAPLFRTGLDEYDSFIRWRKTWKRVTSVKPNWLEDRESGCLWIYNPIERYHCGVILHRAYDDTTQLDDHTSANWVKDYALAKARYTYGEILSKFSGAIPGPLKDLQLDQQKRDKAEAQITKLEEQLRGMQHFAELQID